MIRIDADKGLKIYGACVAVLLSRGPDKRAQIVAIFANETTAGEYSRNLARKSPNCGVSLLHMIEEGCEE